MAEVIRMPRMSDTMEEGVIAAWHKKKGDKVSNGDLLAEIETDKATMDFESPEEGTLLYIGAEEGDSIDINAILAILGDEDEDVDAILKKEKEKEAKESEKEDEEEDEEDDAVEIPTGASGSSEDKSEDKKDKEKEEEKEKKEEKKESKEKSEEEGERKLAKVETEEGRIKASPLARRIAADKEVDLSEIEGSGDDGRIIKKDIEEYIEKGGVKKSKAAEKVDLPEVVQEESYEEVNVSQMRKTIAKRLAESKFNAPHFYLTMEINMDRAIEARKKLNEVAPVKISFNDIVVKATAHALKRHPQVNASWAGDKIRINKHVSVGVAVAVEEGLLVPVIRFTDAKSLAHISQETRELAEKAKKKKLQTEEMQGNTFTISNLGMFDIDEFTAIINSPDSCILAVGKIKEVPVVKDGELATENIMKITLSCDHRVVDGATGAKFLQTLKAYLEEPLAMLI